MAKISIDWPGLFFVTVLPFTVIIDLTRKRVYLFFVLLPLTLGLRRRGNVHVKIYYPDISILKETQP